MQEVHDFNLFFLIIQKETKRYRVKRIFKLRFHLHIVLDIGLYHENLPVFIYSFHAYFKRMIRIYFMLLKIYCVWDNIYNIEITKFNAYYIICDY